MSFRNIIDSECGSINPIVGFSRHYTNDKAFQQTISLNSITNSSHSSQNESNVDSQQLVNEFLSESHHESSYVPLEQPFNMSSLLRDVQTIENHTFVNSAVDSLSIDSKQWSQEFTEDNCLLNKEYNDSLGLESESAQAKWADEYLAESEKQFLPNQSNANQWTDEFVSNESVLAKEANKLMESMDPSLNETEFVKFIKKIGNSEIVINNDGNVVHNSSDEQSMANNWSQELTQTSNSLSQKWSKEFMGKSNEKSEQEYDDDSEFWSKLAKDWKEMGLVEDNSDAEHPWLSEYDSIVEPFKDDYHFNEDNPLIEHPDPFEEGLKKLEEGDIPSAVLLFEASVRRNATNANAWKYLGTSQAENEHDSAAIAALKKCLEIEPNNLDALMALAVSYTNETMQTQACTSLKEWIKRNHKYQNLIPHELEVPQHKTEGFSFVSSIITSGQHQEVKDLFIAAARQSPSDPDADVQCGLGVLFNLSGEYDKAADCFQSALEVRPNDSLLWNRLGATLANGNKSEEAICAYREALSLSPGFIRSRFNLGISCINLNAYREAAEHFLTVLNIQASGRGPIGSRPLMSANVWSTLRMVMTLMNRTDLFAAVDDRDLAKLNIEFNMSETNT